MVDGQKPPSLPRQAGSCLRTLSPTANALWAWTVGGLFRRWDVFFLSVFIFILTFSLGSLSRCDVAARWPSGSVGTYYMARGGREGSFSLVAGPQFGESGGTSRKARWMQRERGQEG